MDGNAFNSGATMQVKQQAQKKTAEQLRELIQNGQIQKADELLSQLDGEITNVNLLLEAGKCLYFQGRHIEAIEHLKRACQIDANNSEVRQMLWSSYRDCRKYSEMLELTEIISKNILSSSELLMVFRSYLGVCDWHKAREYQKEIIDLGLKGKIQADMLPALLIETCALPDLDQTSVRDLHCRFGNALFEARKHAMPASYPALKNLGGRLKIAYVSADFNLHPVGCFINHIITNHLRDQFEVFCYAHLVRQDDITEHIRTNVDHFVDVTALSDAELAARIHADGIHVAIELGGLTTNSRVAAFAHRPAPVQITYLGYPNTTGLSTVDYRITDNFADEDSDAFYREELIRMPQSFICYGFDTSGYSQEKSPAEANGHITFGSFNHVRKLNPEVIETWCDILKRVDDSQLILKAKDLDDEIIKGNIIAEFESHGIGRDRLQVYGFTQRYEDNFKMYNQVDIALDTFPYNGTTTTCDALSLGVPVLTLVGKSHAQRVSYSILKNIGFEESIAFSRDEYIEKAVRMSQNPSALSLIRSCLIPLFKHSILRNPLLFTRQLEKLISDAWIKKTGLPLPAALQAETPSSETATAEPDRSEPVSSKPATSTTGSADSTGRKLHIGGREKRDSWEIFDAIPSDLVDHVGNANDLSRFEDNTFDALYSSHVLEHFSYQGELTQVLAEWHRVLKPEGTIYASVPNMEVLCELFLDKENLSSDDRFMVMRMMFGGQVDAYDFHKVGYNTEILASYLLQAGFENVRHMPNFGLFQDTSNMVFAGKHISLNLVAEKKKALNDLIWVCSYPKSGNTMVRIAIEHYFNRPTLSIYQNTKGDNSPLFGDDFSKPPIGIKCHDMDLIPNDACMVYIYRDPRDALISTFKWKSELLPNSDTELFNSYLAEELPAWKAEIEKALQFPGRKLLIRYEDIVENPKESYKKIFLFMSDDQQVNNKLLKKTIAKTTKKEAAKWFKKRGFDKKIMPVENKTTRWRELMTAEQIQLVNQILGESFLSELGYSPD